MYYGGLGDAESAYADLEQAYEINPDYSFLQQAARIAIETGELDRAQAYFERLISEHNGEPAFVAGRGYLELLQGRTADAHASADLALSLNPDLLPGHYLLGVVLMEEGNPQDAIGQFQFITEREDEWYNDAQYTPGLFTSNFGHELYYDLAQATWGAGDADGALGLIEAGIEREDWAGPYVLRGDILADQGDLAGAREAYLTALDYAYDDPDLQTEIQDRLAGLSGG
jgi:tetratricopeptide (TPR) repeat protein